MKCKWYLVKLTYFYWALIRRIQTDMRIKLIVIYLFREILRVIDSLQLTATKKVATPADWQASFLPKRICSVWNTWDPGPILLYTLKKYFIAHGRSASFKHLLQPGDKCMVIPSISTAEAEKIFPKGVEVRAVPSGKEYLRFTPHP